MKLDYFTLLSDEPLKIHGVGSIKPIYLWEIKKLTIHQYNAFLNLLLLDIDSYYEMVTSDKYDYFEGYSDTEKEMVLTIKNTYDSSSAEDKLSIPFFNVLIFDTRMLENIITALEFFLCEKIRFDDKELKLVTHIEEEKVLETGEATIDEIVVGEINTFSYSSVVDVILQRQCIEKTVKDEEVKSAKNSLVLKLMEKMKKGQAELDKAKKKEPSKDAELGNIISSVAGKDPSLNMITIWDMTIYNLYDQFKRLKINHSHGVQSMQVAAWGDEKNKYDSDLWNKHL